MNTPGAYRSAIRQELAIQRAKRGRQENLQPSPLIELRDVWLSFTRPILRGVDLRVYPGETLVVFGESGVGKSTLLKLILRLLVPDSGQVLVFGQDIGRLSFEEE